MSQSRIRSVRAAYSSHVDASRAATSAPDASPRAPAASPTCAVLDTRRPGRKQPTADLAGLMPATSRTDDRHTVAALRARAASPANATGPLRASGSAPVTARIERLDSGSWWQLERAARPLARAGIQHNGAARRRAGAQAAPPGCHCAMPSRPRPAAIRHYRPLDRQETDRMRITDMKLATLATLALLHGPRHDRGDRPRGGRADAGMARIPGGRHLQQRAVQNSRPDYTDSSTSWSAAVAVAGGVGAVVEAEIPADPASPSGCPRLRRPASWSTGAFACAGRTAAQPVGRCERDADCINAGSARGDRRRRRRQRWRPRSLPAGIDGRARRQRREPGADVTSPRGFGGGRGMPGTTTGPGLGGAGGVVPSDCASACSASPGTAGAPAVHRRRQRRHGADKLLFGGDGGDGFFGAVAAVPPRPRRRRRRAGRPCRRRRWRLEPRPGRRPREAQHGQQIHPADPLQLPHRRRAAPRSSGHVAESRRDDPPGRGGDGPLRCADDIGVASRGTPRTVAGSTRADPVARS